MTKHDKTQQKPSLDTVLALADREQGNIEEAKGHVAGLLMDLAKPFKTADLFKEACKKAESNRREAIYKAMSDDGKAYTAKDKRAAVKLPSCWSNAKSNIFVAWDKFKIAPNKYKTYYELYEALNAERKKLNEKPAPTGKVSDADTITQVTGNSVTGALFAELLKRLSKLEPEQQQEIAHAVNEMITVCEAEKEKEPAGTLVDEELEDTQIHVARQAQA